jgi:hypothetical protein
MLSIIVVNKHLLLFIFDIVIRHVLTAVRVRSAVLNPAGLILGVTLA